MHQQSNQWDTFSRIAGTRRQINKILEKYSESSRILLLLPSFLPNPLLTRNN
jgi:hypothetical protein